MNIYNDKSIIKWNSQSIHTIEKKKINTCILYKHLIMHLRKKVCMTPNELFTLFHIGFAIVKKCRWMLLYYTYIIPDNIHKKKSQL